MENYVHVDSFINPLQSKLCSERSMQLLLSILLHVFNQIAGAGWYLDKVMVTVGKDTEAKTVHFPCNEWLDEGIGDHKIERTLYPQDPEKDSRMLHN